MIPLTTGAVVLAAGKGTRMHSPRPKVLLTLAGEPMLGLLFATLDPMFGGRVWTVIGHGADHVRAAFPGREAGWVEQCEQLGTGHALQMAWPDLKEAGLTHVVVVNGDTPLLAPQDVEGLLAETQAADADLAFLTLTLEDPGAFGRVVRDGKGRVARIVEAKDLAGDAEAQASREINAGIYCLKVAALEELLFSLSRDNAGREYYLTDLIGMARDKGLTVLGLDRGAEKEIMGINSPAELADMEQALCKRLTDKSLAAGVLIRFPDHVRMGPRVAIEPGAEIVGPCELLGATRVAAGAVVESHCVLLDSEIGPGSRIRNFSHLEGACVGAECVVGPYARLRPGAIMDEASRVGNFVEMKKARLGKGAKANHLTYLGDAEVGAGSNIGAGTITCNYDGKNKFVTEIGEKAFIGSNTALVAPVKVGDRALVGAGSVVTKDVPEDGMAIARSRQVNLPKRGGS